MVLKKLLALILSLSLIFATSFTLAQTLEAAHIADGALEGWKGGQFTVSPEKLLQTGNPDFKKLEQAMVDMLRFTPAPGDVRYNFELRKFVGVDKKTKHETYRYPVSSGGVDFEVDVTVTPSTTKGWEAYSIRLASQDTGLPDFLRSSLSSWIFAALSLLLLYGIIRPTLWRSWLQKGFAIAKEHQAVFITTNVVLYGSFILGTLASLGLPELSKELGDFVGSSLQSLGIGDFIQKDAAVGPLATAIFYQNFTSGAFATTYIPGLFFGIPALLLNLVRFGVLGFALSPTAIGTLPYLLHIPTILIELQAYIFITASSLCLIWRIRKVGWNKAFADYGYSLLIACTLLMGAAWYEALEVLVLIPQLGIK